MESLNKIDNYSELNNYLNNYCKRMDNSKFLLNGLYFYDLTSYLYSFINDKVSLYNLNTPVGSWQSENNLSSMEVLSIVEEYFGERAPKYKSLFLKAIQDGTINLNIDRGLDNGFTLLDSELENVAGLDLENHLHANCVFNHDYGDPSLLIHEFFHTLNLDKKGNISLNRSYFTEAISIYFEMDIFNFMLEKGYDSRDIFHYRLERLIDLYHCCSSMINIFPVLNCFRNIGPINENSFDDMEKLNIFPRPYKKEDFYNRVERTKNELLIEDALNPLKIFGYVIGPLLAYYVTDKNSDEMHRKMINLNDTVNSRTFYDVLEDFGIGPSNSTDLRESLKGPLENEIKRVSIGLGIKEAKKK